MSQSKLPLLHQVIIETPPMELLDWIEEEFNKYNSGKPTLFDRGKSKVERLKIYIERASDRTLSVSTYKIIGSKQKVIKPSDMLKIVEFVADEQLRNRWELSMRGSETNPRILEFAENVWKQVDYKLGFDSIDIGLQARLQEKYKEVVLLDNVYNVDPASLEDILRDFLLFEKEDYLKGFGLKIQKKFRGNKQIYFQYMLGYFGEFGYIGDVFALPINATATHVKVSYSGPFSFNEYRDDVYKASGMFFRSLVNHVLSLISITGPKVSEPRTKTHSLSKKPPAGSSREEFFEYYYQLRKRRIRKYTYDEMMLDLGLSKQATKNAYSDWLSKRVYEHEDIF